MLIDFSNASQNIHVRLQTLITLNKPSYSFIFDSCFNLIEWLMKKVISLIILSGWISAAITSYAQGPEICANSIDDDGDGFIDCFDGECANQVVCNGGYIGNDLNCEAKPSEFPKFSISLESASENGTANHLGRIVVGDIDRGSHFSSIYACLCLDASLTMPHLIDGGRQPDRRSCGGWSR